MSTSPLWAYLEDIEEARLGSVLARWREAMPAAGVLALVAEADRDGVTRLQAGAAAVGVPLVGAVFPRLLVGDRFLGRGVLLLAVDPMPAYCLVGDLSVGKAETAAAVGDLARLATGLTSGTLFLLFDGMVGHIASIIDDLYAVVGDACLYAGVNAGSERFQTMPCLFDGSRCLGDGVLALALPEHPGALLEHGYQVPEQLLTASSSHGNRIAELDWQPAFDRYGALLAETYGATLTRDNIYPIGVHFPFALLRAEGETLVRIPVDCGANGELVCIGEIPDNALLTVVNAPAAGDRRTTDKLGAALRTAAVDSVLLFYCAGRQLHLQQGATTELAAISGHLRIPPVGALSLGEIGNARQGGYPLFHNATILVLPWRL